MEPSAKRNPPPRSVDEARRLISDAIQATGLQLSGGLDTDVEIPLGEIYVNLQLLDQARLKSLLCDESMVGSKPSERPLEHEMSLDELLASKSDHGTNSANNALALGSGGTGKSTAFLLSAVYKWSRGELWRDRFDLVFAVPLRKPAVQKAKSLHELLSTKLKSMDMDDDELQELARHLRSNPHRLCLILDGLDECRLSGLSTYMNDLVLRKGSVSAASVIVTSRPCQDASNLSHCGKYRRKVEVLGFSDSGVKSYIRRALEPEKAQLMMLHLQKDPELKTLLRTPLYAATLCTMYKAGFKVPHSITRIYEMMVMRILAGRSTDCVTRGLEAASVALQESEAVRSLGRLAYSMLLENQYEFAKSKVEPAVHGLGFLRSSPEGIAAGEILCWFHHATFQEYFAALYKTRLCDWCKQASLMEITVELETMQAISPLCWQFMLAMLPSEDVGVVLEMIWENAISKDNPASQDEPSERSEDSGDDDDEDNGDEDDRDGDGDDEDDGDGDDEDDGDEDDGDEDDGDDEDDGVDEDVGDDEDLKDTDESNNASPPDASPLTSQESELAMDSAGKDLYSSPRMKTQHETTRGGRKSSSHNDNSGYVLKSCEEGPPSSSSNSSEDSITNPDKWARGNPDTDMFGNSESGDSTEISSDTGSSGGSGSAPALHAEPVVLRLPRHREMVLKFLTDVLARPVLEALAKSLLSGHTKDVDGRIKNEFPVKEEHSDSLYLLTMVKLWEKWEKTPTSTLILHALQKIDETAAEGFHKLLRAEAQNVAIKPRPAKTGRERFCLLRLLIALCEHASFNATSCKGKCTLLPLVFPDGLIISIERVAASLDHRACSAISHIISDHDCISFPSINLEDCIMMDAGFSMVSASLSARRNLDVRVLDVRGAAIRDSALLVSAIDALKADLLDVYVGDNPTGRDGLVAVCRAVSTCTHARYVDVSSMNNAGPATVECITEIVKQCTELCELILSWNNIKPDHPEQSTRLVNAVEAHCYLETIEAKGPDKSRGFQDSWLNLQLTSLAQKSRPFRYITL
eukprot:scpid28056/ scgid6234/ NACHT, LRR and PYD domains-containing protein 3; Cold autoinflammatory syndrome 1 protein homolog; Cryopyrin; Mast cell maturation-associated-inducible protein 1; PYRIN-containing APAF1-like protein 1